MIQKKNSEPMKNSWFCNIISHLASYMENFIFLAIVYSILWCKNTSNYIQYVSQEFALPTVARVVMEKPIKQFTHFVSNNYSPKK